MCHRGQGAICSETAQRRVRSAVRVGPLSGRGAPAPTRVLFLDRHQLRADSRNPMQGDQRCFSFPDRLGLTTDRLSRLED